MKICKKCGRKYEGEEKFCKNCGAPLEEMKAVKEPQKPKKPEEPKEPKKKSKAGLYILIGVLAVALIGGAAVTIKVMQDKKQEEREAKEEEERREEEREEKEREEREKDKKKEKDEKEKEDKEKEKEAEKESEEEKAAREKEELEKQEAEEQAELLKKYEEQEAAERAAEQAANTPSSIYDIWSEKLEAAEETDSSLKDSVSESSSYTDVLAMEQKRYELWDGLLNAMWKDLKNTLNKTDMDSLTKEQVQWIKDKESMITGYWKSQGTTYETYKNAPASDTTKTRVYYLLNKF